MVNKVFITGINGIGKTTLVKRLYRDLSMLVVKGYYKESIVENDIIKGYRLITFDLEEQIIAHVHFVGPDRWSGFGINVSGFEKLVMPQIEYQKADLYMFDEIGFLECYSETFCQKFKDLINGPVPVIATFSNIRPVAFRELKKNKNVKLLHMTKENRKTLWKNVLVEL